MPLIPSHWETRAHSFLRSRLWLWLMLGIGCLQFIPFLLLGGDSHFIVHDQLDGDLPVMKAMIDHGDAFSFGGNMDYLMEGVPRACGRSGLNLTVLLLAVFGTPAGLILNLVLAHLVGFAGMYLLLKKHLLRDSQHSWLPAVVALLFSFVGWYSLLGWFVAGQPLLYYCFLNLYKNKQSLADWIYIALFPFTCPLIIIAPFLLTLLGLAFLYLAWQDKIFSRKYLLGLLVLLAGFLLSDIGMIYETLINRSFVSHRTEWPLPEPVGLKTGFVNAFGTLFFTHFHAGQFLTRLIIAAFVICLSIGWAERRIEKKLFIIPVIIFTICLFQAFAPAITHYLGGRIGMLKVVQVDRFYNLLPCLWLIFFALLLNEIFRIRHLHLIGLLLILGQGIAIIAGNKEVVESSKIVLGKKTEISYNEFYAPGQFAAIRDHIGLPQESFKVVSLGIQPAVATYNGFYCLDAYLSNYPLDYKKRFRKVMEKELDRSPEKKKYFDEWGSRCYLFAADINGNYGATKDLGLKVEKLDLDLDELSALECRYLISAVEIRDTEDSGLVLDKRFGNDGSAWDIWLYRFKPL